MFQVWPKGIFVSNGSRQHCISSPEVTDCILFTILQEAVPSSGGVGELLDTDPEASLPPNSARPPHLPLHHLPLLCSHAWLHQIMFWLDWKRQNFMSSRASKKNIFLRKIEILLTPTQMLIQLIEFALFFCLLIFHSGGCVLPVSLAHGCLVRYT